MLCGALLKLVAISKGHDTTHNESPVLSMAPIPLVVRRKALLIGINYDSEGTTAVLEGSHHNVKVLKNLLMGE